MRFMIDVAAGSTLMRKTKDEEINLIKEMTLNNYQWSNNGGQPKRVGGNFDIDTLTLLTTKLDAMCQRLDRLNVNVVNACVPSLTYDSCGSFDHLNVNCKVRDSFASCCSDQVAYANLGCASVQDRTGPDRTGLDRRPKWGHGLDRGPINDRTGQVKDR